MTRKTKEEIIYGDNSSSSTSSHKARNANDYDAMLFDFLEKEFNKKESN